MKQRYDLTSLVTARRVAGLIGFNLETKFGSECLGVADTKMGADVRLEYKRALRTLRLRQSGFDLVSARQLARVPSQSFPPGMMALYRQGAEKQGETLFGYWLKVMASREVQQ